MSGESRRDKRASEGGARCSAAAGAGRGCDLGLFERLVEAALTWMLKLELARCAVAGLALCSQLDLLPITITHSPARPLARSPSTEIDAPTY